MNDLYKPETAKFIHQFLDNFLPALFEKYFTHITFVHRHSTRTYEQNDYFLPHYVAFTRFYKIFLSKNMEFDLVQIQKSIF